MAETPDELEEWVGAALPTCAFKLDDNLAASGPLVWACTAPAMNDHDLCASHTGRSDRAGIWATSVHLVYRERPHVRFFETRPGYPRTDSDIEFVQRMQALRDAQAQAANLDEEPTPR